MVLFRKLFSHFSFLISFLLFSSTILVAQGKFGQIHGVITDSVTSNPLFGANIMLKSTGLGAASDIDGNYKITQIPAGSYIMVIRYIGYKGKEIPVEVKAGEAEKIDVILASEAIEGKEVIVTAQALGQKVAINQQLTSNTIINVVSAEKIHQLPDDNASAALSRLPGVSIMNGDQVVIRGIQAKMNEVLINGIQLPSTDMTSRATDLGFISSNMLSGIEVVKALTPDMDANTIGGVVNLRLREAPKEFHFDVLTQGNYNSQDRTTDNYKFWMSASKRFFNDKLGVFLQGNADRSNVGEQQAAATYAISQNLPYGQAPYQMTTFTFTSQENIITNNGGSLILDYLLPHGKIMFQNTYAHNLSDLTNYKSILHFNTIENDYSMFRDKYGKDLLINALQSEFNFNDIKVEFTLSHSFSNKYTYIRYGDPGNFFGFYNTDQNHPYGVDASGNAISYAGQMQYMTPEDVYKIKIDPTDPLGAKLQGWVVGRSETFWQHLYNSALDVTVPVSISQDIVSKFKIGGKFARTTRFDDVNAEFKGSSDPDLYYTVANMFPGKTLSLTNPLLFSDVWDKNYKRGQYFLNDTYNFQYPISKDLMDKFMTLSPEGWVQRLYKPGSLQNDFTGAEIFSAGYLMGTFDIGPRLTILAGLRYEHYNMDYKANFVYVTHEVYGYANLYDTLNTVDRSDNNFFPNLQIRYKINDWSDIRAAFTQSISRADYNAIMPNTYVVPGGTLEAGNTRLEPTKATNFDLSWSIYNNEIGLFTISGFYKKLDNIFYQTNIYYKNLSYWNVSFPDSSVFAALNVPAPSASQQVTTYVNNPHPAYVRGIELEWQTNFWYLPQPLNSLVLNVNYTKAWSDMDYQQIRNIDSTYQVGRFTYHEYLTRDTIRNARLVYQADDVLNIALGIDYKGFSGRLSFNLSGNIITSVGSRPEADQFTGNIYRWDFTLKQDLPIDGLSIAFNGVNIFHNPIYTYQDFRRVTGGPVLNNLQSTDYSPTIFQVNLRYSL